MSGRLPRVTADDITKALEKAGSTLARQSGSHRIYKHPEGKRATVPYHRGKTLHPRVLTSILADADLSRDELIKLLKQ